jgi:hypothetical protein
MTITMYIFFISFTLFRTFVFVYDVWKLVCSCHRRSQERFVITCGSSWTRTQVTHDEKSVNSRLCSTYNEFDQYYLELAYEIVIFLNWFTILNNVSKQSYFIQICIYESYCYLCLTPHFACKKKPKLPRITDKPSGTNSWW